MPMYWTLKRAAAADRHRIIDSISRLRRQIAREIPRRTARDTLLLATWNLRDFDSNKFGHGPRLPESFHYMAEIIAAFDIVALQEINRSLRGLERVMKLLGPRWQYIITDVTEGPSGNGERMAYVYDSRKVHFQHVAGEVVLPDSQLVNGEKQMARTPFLGAFQSHWLKFTLCNVHMYYGGSSGPGYDRRVKEIEQIGKFL
ncbi:MAG: endonuclease/exonuclease/phosphatase family protein, partial [Gemmatimonadetes bacterium]|nr:endonuclease/exonuclease/phosphatase family protein [Gemmatimonadota bacterium]